MTMICLQRNQHRIRADYSENQQQQWRHCQCLSSFESVTHARVILGNFLRWAVSWWRRFLYNAVFDRTAEVTYCRLPSSPESWLLAAVKASPCRAHPTFASRVTHWSVHKLQAHRYHYHIIIAILYYALVQVMKLRIFVLSWVLQIKSQQICVFLNVFFCYYFFFEQFFFEQS